MQQYKSHSGPPLRVRRGIFYFLCLLVLLEAGRSRLGKYQADRQPPLMVLDSLRQFQTDSLKMEATLPRNSHPVRIHDHRATLPGKPIAKACLNQATAEDLMAIRGIGPVLSGRILKFRNLLGGFLDSTQLYDVYGLSPEVARRAMERFRICSPPPVHRVNLNTAGIPDLAGIPYLNWAIARDLVRYREAHGPFLNLSQLKEVESIPADKIDRIGLYLGL